MVDVGNVEVGDHTAVFTEVLQRANKTNMLNDLYGSACQSFLSHLKMTNKTLIPNNVSL